MQTKRDIVVERAGEPTPEVRSLVEALDGELSQNYCCDQRHGLKLDAIFQPHVRFFVARVDGQPAGCGGIALMDGFAEVKRMYVRPVFRGQGNVGVGSGVADAILNRLESEAAGAGLRVLRLETGTKQLAAIRFYQRNGFEPCDAFEPYASMPVHNIKESVFLEKRLV